MCVCVCVRACARASGAARRLSLPLAAGAAARAAVRQPSSLAKLHLPQPLPFAVAFAAVTARKRAPH